MTMPGFVTGQPLSGPGIGQAVFQLMPCLPHEGPPGMPRSLAKQLFPQGFFPGMIPAAQVAPPVQPVLIPPKVAAPPVVPAPPPVDARGNQILRRQPPAAIAPRPAPSQADRDRDIRFRRMMHRRIT